MQISKQRLHLPQFKAFRNTSHQEYGVDDIQNKETKVEGVLHLWPKQDVSGDNVEENTDDGKDGFGDTIKPICRVLDPKLLGFGVIWAKQDKLQRSVVPGFFLFRYVPVSYIFNRNTHLSSIPVH